MPGLAVVSSQLEGLQGPLASLNMASHIIYRYTRVRAIAFGYVSQVSGWELVSA